MGLLQDIQKRIKQKENEISDLEHEMELLDRRRAAAKAYIAGLQDILPKVQREGAEGHVASPANGKTLVFRKGSGPELVHEILLRSGSPMHIDKILEKLGKGGNKKAKLVLVGTLSRYAKQGVVFRRTAPNTFSLISSAISRVDELPQDFGK